MTARDFRSSRTKLKPDDFVFAVGEDVPPTDLITPETWRSITSLPDDVSLRTSDSYGTVLGVLWDLWGEWICLVGALQESAPSPSDSPIASAACDATDYFQGSVHNALTGYYRLAFTSLRGVVENMTVGALFELGCAPIAFAEYLAGDDLRFAAAADSIVADARVAGSERDLQVAIGDDFYRQRKPASDDGGYARRLFRRLSKYAHGVPRYTDADMWRSNGPVFAPDAFEDWARCFFEVVALAVVQSRIAHPALKRLGYGSELDARELFVRAVHELPPSSEARRLFGAVPPTVW